MEQPKFVYITYIHATPEKVWQAITQPEFTRQYWGGRANVSDWKEGSKWNHESDGKGGCCTSGVVVECEPPSRLVLTWEDSANPSDTSVATIEIQPMDDLVRLRITHSEFKPGSTMAGKVSLGWPLVLSSLKSFLETGKGIDIWAESIMAGMKN